MKEAVCTALPFRIRGTIPLIPVSLAVGLAILAAGAGCSAPSIALDPEAEAVAYYVSENPETVRTVETFRTPDGRELALVAHRRTGIRARCALVYLHGISSHAGWFDHAGDLLAADGFDVYCLDRRGSGLNRENRGFPSGHIDSFQTFIEDIRAFIRPLRGRYDAVYLVGLSWGGKLAVGYGLTHGEDLDGLVLITPGLKAKVDVSFFTKLKILFSSTKTPIRIPIQPEMFTPTERYLELIRSDPIRLRYATAGFMMESHRFDGYIDERVEENRLPVLLFLAGRDQIIENADVVALLARGRQEVFDIRRYDDQTHSIQFDAPERLARDVTAWLARRGAAPAE